MVKPRWGAVLDPSGLRDVVMRRRATLPHPVECSTIAVPSLSFRVRNGTGRLTWAMTAARGNNTRTYGIRQISACRAAQRHPCAHATHASAPPSPGFAHMIIAHCGVPGRHRHACSTVAQVSRIAGTPGRAGDFDVNGSRRVDCFLRTRRTSCVAPRIRPQRLASPCRTLIQSHPHGMAHGPFRGALAPTGRRNAAPTAQEHRHARPCAGGPTVMQIGRIGGGNGYAHTMAGDQEPVGIDAVWRTGH